MLFRAAILILIALVVSASGGGCRKPENHAAVAPTVLSPDTIASVHWTGKHRLDLQADACYFARVWSLPETARLQAQTFDRLSTGVWRQLLGEPAAARIPAAVLRPLFEELALQESYLEIRAATDAPPSVVLAIHAGALGAGIWQTNLAVAVRLFTESPVTVNPARHGWMLRRMNAPDLITLDCVGEWVIVSVGPEQNSLTDDIIGRIRRDGLPFVSAGTNLWLESSLNLPRLAAGHFLPASPIRSASMDHLSLDITGDGADVIMQGKLTFSQPLDGPLEAWRPPMDLLNKPVTSFSAVRGIGPWLARWGTWTNLQMGAAPDQLFVWSVPGDPSQLYLAAPLTNAASQVSLLTDHLLDQANSRLATNGYPIFARASDSNGVVWGNLSDLKPFIKSAGAGDDNWLYAGLMPDPGAEDGPAPVAMIQRALGPANLVYCNREVTGARVEPCFFLGQSLCRAFRWPQLEAQSAAGEWLHMLVPRLRESTTTVTLTGPAELTLYRRSTLGFTAPELQVIASWLESPQFPALP